LFCQSAHFNRANADAPRRTASRTYEDEGWPQGAGGAPQEGTPSAHPRIVRGAVAHGQFKRHGNLFPREARLVRRGEFDAVYRAGKRRSSSHFTVFFRANELPQSRFGFSIKKALGGAVVRNRIRRRLRESCAATGWRYPQDGTLSYTRRVRWRARRLQR